jgi:hypothetical protein
MFGKEQARRRVREVKIANIVPSIETGRHRSSDVYGL